MHCGNRLREIQAAKAIKCVDLAKHLDVRPSQVTRWRQQSDFKLATMQALCEALGVSLSEFLGEKSPQ